MIATRARRRPAGLVLLPALMAAILAGCGGAATPVPAPVGASPTAVIAPAATGTPIPATPAASPSPSPLATTYPLSLTDDEGTAVTIAARPTKIVSLTPATTEILFAVGAGPRVSGVTDADDYPPAAKQITQVVKLGAVDVEKIVGLGADLVIAGGNGLNSPDAIAKLRSLGIPVVVVYASNVAGVLTDIQLVAAAAGEPAAASALVASMRDEVDAVKAAVSAAGGARPLVFYETGYFQGTIYGIADASAYADEIAIAGGNPVTTGSTTKWNIPLESLITADPQVIILGDGISGLTVGEVKARTGWGVIRAVKTGAIRLIDDTVVTRPGPRIVEGLRALAVAINPALRLPPAPAASTTP
jgi:iron complex transport system substrate-binding protein